MKQFKKINYYLGKKEIDGIPNEVIVVTVFYEKEGRINYMYYDVEHNVDELGRKKSFLESGENYLRRFKKANAQLPKTSEGIEKIVKKLETQNIESFNFP